MPSFLYTGRAAGQPVSGTLDGADARSVATLLQSRGILPLTIAPRAGAGAAAAATAGGAIGGALGSGGLGGGLGSALGSALGGGLGGSAGSGSAGGAATGSANPGASAEGGGGEGTGAGALRRRGKVLPVEVMLFSRQLHTLLRAGVPILRALAGLQESCVNPFFAGVILQLRTSLESGFELSRGLALHGRIFDSFYVAMVRVGEMTGRLDEVLDRLAEHLDFEIFMRQQIKSALRYPGFVIAAMVGAIGVINVLVIPAFAQVFESMGAKLPLATRVLLATSRFTLDYGWLLALAAVAAWAAFVRWRRSAAGKLRWEHLILRVPLAGPIVRKATMARFARSFALAFKSGLPIEQTLSVTAQTVDNAWIARQVDGMRESVERGDSILRAAVASGVFTPVVLQMIGVGEETGALDRLMEEVAELYNREVQYELKTLSQQIEPILVVILGMMVLVLALGVFLPMWDLGAAALKR